MTSLRKLHIFRPTSSIQLAVTLLHLPAYHISQLLDAEIGLLAIDSISSFYWPDRFTVEQMRSAPPFTADQPTPAFVSPLQHVLTALQKFRLSHGPVIIVTNWGLTPLPNSLFYRQHLHPFPVLLANPHHSETAATLEVTRNAYSSAIENPHTLPPLTHHITLPVIPFPQTQSVDLPKEAKEHPREPPKMGEVVGIVRTAGSPRVGRFEFRIGEIEILIGDDDHDSAVRQ